MRRVVTIASIAQRLTDNPRVVFRIEHDDLEAFTFDRLAKAGRDPKAIAEQIQAQLVGHCGPGVTVGPGPDASWNDAGQKLERCRPDPNPCRNTDECGDADFDPEGDYANGVYLISTDGNFGDVTREWGFADNDCYLAVIREDGIWFAGTVDRPRLENLDKIQGRLRGPFPRFKEAW